MRRLIENLEIFAIEVILGKRKGFRADCFRAFLSCLAWVYRFVTQARLALYRRRYFRSYAMGCTVVSVGNLTVGGTGKTPVVEMLARMLQQRGRRVAILSRGYKSVPKPFLVRLWQKVTKRGQGFKPRIVSDGLALLLDSRLAGDEPFMLAKNLRDVVVLVHRDRVKSGYYAVSRFGSDTLILDDGYQYVRMGRNIEIALVDRTAPFGSGHLLPRGTLREIPSNLARATHIFLTKCDTDSDYSELITQLRRVNCTAPVIECTHHAVALYNIHTAEVVPLEYLKGRKIGALCGIAVPESFHSALKARGATIVLKKDYTDHHRYSVREIEHFIHRCSRREVDAILTTEKDAVRIPRIATPEIPIYYMRVEIQVLRGHEQLEELVDTITVKGAMRG